MIRKKAKKEKKTAKKNSIKKKIKKVAPKKQVKKISIKKKIKKVVKKTKTKTKKKLISRISRKKINKKQSFQLERFVGNPIIHPARDTYWESTATFNPTAFEHDGKIHILYRAVGIGDISTIGYAQSNDGLNLFGRNFKPIFIHSNDRKDLDNPIFYSSGGGWNGGAEDPRITKLDNKLYMTYTAFDGWGSVRIGLTWIDLEDFLNKKWNWRKPVLISPPGQIHKNWVIFPEKINKQYAILHSLSPEIQIEYVKNLDSFDGKKFIKSIHQDDPKWQLRERGMRGVGPSPIKTKYGWLIFYHAMEKEDPNRYKLFAMLLDLKNPSKILYRSSKAVLEPDMFYENEGYKWGVVYSCGALVKNNELFVYYGGADMVSCVAVADFELFLKELRTSGKPKLNKPARNIKA
jgi:predicted GH43/DUF377 family glycosyl hydrolase